MLGRSLLVLSLVVGSACDGGDLTPEQSLEKSCAGEVIPNCRPYEYAIVREATLMPANVEVGDPLATIDVRFVIEACADAPMAHLVGLTALDETGGRDGGMTGSMVTLDSFSDGSARDGNTEVGVFEGTAENFFLTGLVSPETELLLTFAPRIDVCRGAGVELAYRTGPAYEMSGP